ncbi:hypothetical protein [Phytohabitans kaempferiae]|uniref:Lipocalin-like domain-containing protein n=1 Tax=Phytohabitans kaempferiae TaxID=1620943 RepID=A0ABV6LZV7_9ACTN
MLIGMWYLVAETQMETTGRRNPQYDLLRAGKDVVLSRESLASAAPHSAMPDLSASAWWKLSGGNTLTAAPAPD